MKKAIREYRIVVIAAAANLVLWCFSPSKASISLNTTAGIFKEMLLILPPMFLLVGLLEVWVPRETVERYVGHHSGVTGIAISMLLGSLSVGPLYAAFPMAAMLLKKGARVFNVVAFLTMKAAGEVPLVAMEARFLGVRFALTRILLTAAAALLIGWITEKALGDAYAANLGESQE